MNDTVFKSVLFPDQTAVPSLGQGTWRLGEDSRRKAEETVAVRAGVELGMTVIDTAEMYGGGSTERFLGQAIAGLRERVFLVSKVYPQNASRAGLTLACEASLGRLGTDRIDLYLLHWRGSVPLEETVAGMEALVASGKIRMWGVSNLDADDMDELFAVGGTACATDQVLYNLGRRGPEFDLIPALETRRIPVMAYSPIDQGRLAAVPALRKIAEARGVKPAQMALAWLLARKQTLVIPKASTLEHVRENRAAADLALTAEELAALDRAFPPPRNKQALAML